MNDSAHQSPDTCTLQSFTVISSLKLINKDAEIYYGICLQHVRLKKAIEPYNEKIKNSETENKGGQ